MGGSPGLLENGLVGAKRLGQPVRPHCPPYWRRGRLEPGGEVRVRAQGLSPPAEGCWAHPHASHCSLNLGGLGPQLSLGHALRDLGPVPLLRGLGHQDYMLRVFCVSVSMGLV